MTQIASTKNPSQIRITLDSVPEARTRAPEPERKLGTIMVVDDDPRIRQAVQWALEDEGYAVVAAADGRQALDAAATQRPALIVLDNGLPEASGAQVAAQLREIGGESLPILLITADGRAREKAQLAGAFAYLHKPFHMDELVQLIHVRLRLDD